MTGARGFTLVELLVSMGVVVLLLTFVMRLVSGTTATITTSNKQLDTASLARIVLDRIGNDLSGAVFTGGATILHYSEAGDTGNSAMAFVSGSRARGPTTQTSAWTTDTRSAFIGYKVRLVAQNVGGSSPRIPALNRGDGRFTFSTQDADNKATYRVWDVFGANNTRMPNDLVTVPPANDEGILNWQIAASGIFRMHVSFVLDDGRIVQTPPLYRNFFANGDPTAIGCIPIAFSSANSADAGKRYVKGLVVGVAVLDEQTRNLAYRADNNFATTISGKIVRPTVDGETPAEVWDRNLRTLTSNAPSDANYLFPPVRQNIRFYQRFYGVTL